MGKSEGEVGRGANPKERSWKSIWKLNTLQSNLKKLIER